MERSDWTDARLDDRFDHLDAEIAGIRRDIRDLRTELCGEMGALQTGLRGEMGELRNELRGETVELRGLMIRLHATTLIAFLGVIAAFFAGGG